VKRIDEKPSMLFSVEEIVKVDGKVVYGRGKSKCDSGRAV
jgi:hypothetical protein